MLNNIGLRTVPSTCTSESVITPCAQNDEVNDNMQHTIIGISVSVIVLLIVAFIIALIIVVLKHGSNRSAGPAKSN